MLYVYRIINRDSGIVRSTCHVITLIVTDSFKYQCFHYLSSVNATILPHCKRHLRHSQRCSLQIPSATCHDNGKSQISNITLSCTTYPKNFLMFPPICSRSSRNVSCPNNDVSSPNSTCLTNRLPAARNVSAISLCCQAGNKISLATPMTKVGWSRIGARPATRSSGGRLDIDATGSENDCEAAFEGCSS